MGGSFVGIREIGEGEREMGEWREMRVLTVECGLIYLGSCLLILKFLPNQLLAQRPQFVRLGLVFCVGCHGVVRGLAFLDVCAVVIWTRLVIV